MAADVVGYSRLMAADEAGTLAALKRHREAMFNPLVARHAGRIVKLMGDGTLVEFSSVVDAVNCAVAIQRAAAGEAEPAIVLRIGINLGDVIIDGDDIYGDGVNIAARLEPLARQGGICVSSIVRESVGTRSDVTFADGGTVAVKNIDPPLRIWQWHPGDDAGTGTHAADASSGEPAPAGAPPPAAPPGAPSPADRPSIAVLPFANMSGDAEQDYFSDGISEDIITDLSKISGLMVIARNSTFVYKGRSVDLRHVGRELGVTTVLEGSVRRAGGRVRITAQLIDAATGSHLWAERYDRDLTDIFAVQDEVTLQIVNALKVRLGAGERAHLPHADTANPEAYDLLLRGREQYRLFTPQANTAARQLFEQAITADPAYAAAHAALAETHLQDWFLGAADGLDRARELAERARALDPNHPLVREAAASANLFTRRHEEALADAQAWLRIEPGNAEAHANLAGILMFAGEPEKVEPLIDRARRLNPHHPFYYTFYVSCAAYVMGRYEEASRIAARASARSPQALPPLVYLAAAHAQLGEIDKARQALADIRRISPDASIARLRATSPFKNPAHMERLVEGMRKAGLSD